MSKIHIPEILISTDGEFTGRIPGRNSMISLGAVAYCHAGSERGRFKVNLRELPSAERDYATMRWWDEHPAAWQLATKDPVDPVAGMRRFATWLACLGGKPKLMGWPLPVDFMFIYWYYVNFLNEVPPFGFDGIDIKTYAMAALKHNRLSDVSMTQVQAYLGLSTAELIHEPVDDSIRQAEIYFAIRRRMKDLTL